MSAALVYVWPLLMGATFATVLGAFAVMAVRLHRDGEGWTE